MRDKELKLHDGEASHTLDAAGRGGTYGEARGEETRAPTHTVSQWEGCVRAWFVSGRGECVRVKR